MHDIILMDCIAWRRFCHFFYGFVWWSFWIPTFPTWNAFWYKNYNSFKLKKWKLRSKVFFFEWKCLPFPKPNTRWIIESIDYRMFGKQINKLHHWQMTPHAIIPAVKCFTLANINSRNNAAIFLTLRIFLTTDIFSSQLNSWITQIATFCFERYHCVNINLSSPWISQLICFHSMHFCYYEKSQKKFRLNAWIKLNEY